MTKPKPPGELLTTEQRAAITRAKWANPEYRAKEIATRNDPEYRARVSAQHTGLKASEETRAKLRAIRSDPAYKAGVAQRNREWMSDPANRERIREAARERSKNPEYLAKLSKALKGKRRSPEHRAAFSRAQRSLPILGPCAYCGEPATSWDHVIPRSKGGTDDPENLVIACRSCNSSKHNKSLEEWGGPPDRCDTCGQSARSPIARERIKAAREATGDHRVASGQRRASLSGGGGRAIEDDAA